MSQVKAWGADGAKQPLKLFSYDAGTLPEDEVEVAVEHCGICHSDLSVLHNEWGISQFPCVAGHEVVGKVVALGAQTKGLKLGQRVGIGWTAVSCMHCRECLAGQQNLCAKARPTIIGRHGGFAERVRAHWAWVVPLPEGLDASAAGPLLCGGTTVFAPLQVFGVKPTDRVGVVGIGGLGHLALKFAAAWGCEVTAFTSSESKFAEAKQLGAHHVVSSRNAESIRGLAGSLDFLLVTVNVPMDWSALLATLRANGRMHFVGIVPQPIPVPVFELVGQQRSVSGSPTGGPVAIATMLEFAARHRIAPQVERFPMSKINEALRHLEDGKARYRIVLDADF